MKLIKPGLQYYVERIRNNQPFTFSRYGDGEWSAILNDRRLRTGSDSHSLKVPSMQKALRHSLRYAPRKRNYIVAMRGTVRMHDAADEWVNRCAPGLRWHDCTVLYKASKNGHLYPFIKAIRESHLPKIVIGPTRLRKLNGKVFKLAAFVEIPVRDCWGEHRRIIEQVLNFGKPAIITITAGPPAKVFAWWLYKEIGEHSFIIDVGSLWDIYSGKRTRAYMRKMSPATIRRNLHGE
jgi:hypothetical protein